MVISLLLELSNKVDKVSKENEELNKIIKLQNDNCTPFNDVLLYPQNLENRITTNFFADSQEGDEMAKKINRAVTINGIKKYIRADTEQEYADKLAELYGYQKPKTKTNFRQYALNWFEVYKKPNIATVTAHTYQRQLNKYILPQLGDKYLEDITVDDIQILFNDMGNVATETKKKLKTVLAPIFDYAIDDGLISKNPVKSKRLKINGNASKPTATYTVEQMQFLINHIDIVVKEQDRNYLILQALHPLRLEEVLGLKWCDIDLVNRVISINRAVTHPTRNQPEIKETKTEVSKRQIALSAIAADRLKIGNSDDFVLGGYKPLSYQQVVRMCERIARDTQFNDKVTPIRFRTTVLTDIYDTTKDIKLAQQAAGHTTSAMTLKYYVKGRETSQASAIAVDSLYGGLVS